MYSNILDGKALLNNGDFIKGTKQIEALERVAGSEVVKLIKHQPDPTIQKIVSGWARDFDTKRSIELGFKAETNFDEIIKTYIEDDLKQ